MKFHLRIFDNYHHWDEASSYDHGSYETYEEGVIEAKKIVEEFFEGECKPGITANDLMTSFAMYGEEPVVFPDEPKIGKSFSPNDYAEEYVKTTRMNTQTLYQKAIKFAGEKHSNQKVPGTNSNYLLHLSNVAMEILIASNNSTNFELDFAIQVALLHDSLEDTDTTFKELRSNFSQDIADAVSALSKNSDLPKEQQMQDSLNRVKELQQEVWAVKLADRITNLQQPPSHWDTEKKQKYLKQAKLILSELKSGNEYLENRLESKILEYEKTLDKFTQ